MKISRSTIPCSSRELVYAGTTGGLVSEDACANAVGILLNSNQAIASLFSPVATRSAAILPRAYSLKASNLMKRLHATSMLGVRHCE